MDRLKNAVMVADTRPLLVAHILLQLQEDNKGLFDEAIIYHTNFSENDKKLMNSIMPCRFIDYISPIPKETFNLPRFKRFSPIMFVRYEIFNLIREYETIMWIDTDVLIQGDLSKLLEEVKKTGYAMLSEDPHNNSAGNVDYMRTNFFKNVPNYDMDRYLLCTGTIIVNRKLTIKSDYTNWCYKKTIEWAENLNLPDQGVINALVQEFNIKTTPIGHNGVYGCFPSYGRDCSKAIYIHAWGENKFWNDWYLYNKFPKWKEVYDKWIDMGGSRLLDEFVPKVSIVIPTYKPDFGYFKQCLDSLIGQKKNDYERFSNFEIIIISEPLDQENITKFVESYDDNRIQLYFNESRLGIAASLNRGIRLSQGEFIARIDDDDIASPKRIFSQLSYLKENKDITLCTTEYNYFGDMNEGRKVFEGEMSKAWSIFTCPFDHPTIMFRKDFFINNNLFYDENRRFVEDWELWLRAFDKGMKVGCIHEVLMYHRWHNGSAGQSNKTVDMMDELVEQNFLKLDIKIPKDIIQIIRPWNGKVSEENYFKLENIFDTAIRNNYDLKIYDDKSLLHVFSIRLFEAKTGTLPEVNVELKENCIDFGRDNTENTVKGHFLKRALKRILKPLYAPIKNRFENKINNIDRLVWNLTCDVAKIRDLYDNQMFDLKYYNEFSNRKLNTEIKKMQQDLTKKLEQIQSQIINNGDKFDKKIYEENENTRQNLSKRLYEIETEVKNSAYEFDKKIYEENENTRQNLSKRLYEIETEVKNSVYEFDKKIYEENENTRQSLSKKMYETELLINEKTNIKFTEINRHIDFTYRDLMIILDKINNFIKKKNIELKTDFPIAFESNDHKFPHGTIRDNTRYPRFVSKCESLFERNKELSFLDLGCSGGGMVLEAALKGHFSIGLEGSDISFKQQRAEWRLLGENLKTCDITKPFELLLNDDIYKFDIITAWEVLEHIKEEDLEQLFKNIHNHLSDNGRFIASIANWDDIDPITGINWHVTKHDYEWWKNKFEEFGFTICTEELSVYDLARGGYNPPHCYEEPYQEVDLTKGFHIVVIKNGIKI